jgi:hypothetical protein
MATEFDRLVEELQQQVLEDARTAYSDKVSIYRRRDNRSIRPTSLQNPLAPATWPACLIQMPVGSYTVAVAIRWKSICG